MKKFAADLIEDMMLGDEFDGITMVERKCTGQGRWSQTIEAVVKFEGRFYGHGWQEPLTEMQEVERTTGDVECVEMFPHIVEITEYRKEP